MEELKAYRHRYQPAALRNFTKQVFVTYGVPEADAELAAAALVHADLLGIESHGLALLARHGSYLVGIDQRSVHPRPDIRILRETPSTAVLDGDGGLGVVVASRAMQLAMTKAQAVGSGFVAIRNGRHFGAAAHYSLMAADEGLIGLAMCNAPGTQVAPTFGRAARLATNPISVAAPTRSQPTFLLDMATSVVAAGRLSLAIRDQVPIPEGWLLNRDGQPSTNPHDFAAGGTLLPLGSRPELGSYKGYALSATVDVLAGVLSGTGYGAMLSGRTSGVFLGAWQVEAFMALDEFRDLLDQALSTMRDTPPVDGANQILTPGEREWRTAQERERVGIPLRVEVQADLMELGRRTGVDFPESIGVLAQTRGATLTEVEWNEQSRQR
jgi:LDH2 family malate/lactate/ureidoglycolate dehydrogenase